MLSNLLVAVFGQDKTIANLCPKSVNRDRSVHGQYHAGLKYGPVTCYKLGFLQETESGRPAAAD